MHLRLPHVAANISSSLFLLPECTALYGNARLFIHQLRDVGLFSIFLAILNKAPVRL